MNVTTRIHTDGETLIIDYEAETAEDRKANAALFARYDGTGLIGSGSGDGSRLQLIVLPLTPEEIERNAAADAMIAGLNLCGARCLQGQAAIDVESVVFSDQPLLSTGEPTH
ncbi:MAG: hypothetical protein RL150_132 [Candidatus Parcubacteria bacterium]|jgi:hypothetical protein